MITGTPSSTPNATSATQPYGFSTCGVEGEGGFTGGRRRHHCPRRSLGAADDAKADLVDPIVVAF